MRQPDVGARGYGVDDPWEPPGVPGPRPGAGTPGGNGLPGDAAQSRACESASRLPPGQHVQATLPVLHYGPVPTFNPQTWTLLVCGATQSGQDHKWDWEGFQSLPRREIIADFHCVTKFTVLGLTWSGVCPAEILRAVPPAAAATHVMVWADYGYGANLPLEVFGGPDTLLATHREDCELLAEQGHPVRLVVPSKYGWKSVKWVRAIEYMIGDRRGFWEERGYHNGADPWHEQRYSYQEQPGEGPPL